MERIKFEKGRQKKFLISVMEEIASPSLRELSSRVNVNYSTLKNYFSERRNLPKELFENLLFVSKLREEDLKFEVLEENFGQVLGGVKNKYQRLQNNRS
ncbi:MAG: hypothetical protein WDZ77_01195 [Candidatus Pacearchaeota archaeon]